MVTKTQKMSRVCYSGHPQPVSVEASLTLAQLGAQEWDPFGDEFLGRKQNAQS